MGLFNPPRISHRRGHSPVPVFDPSKLSPEARQQQIALWKELEEDGRALAYAKLCGLWCCTGANHYNLCNCQTEEGRTRRRLTKQLIKEWQRECRIGIGEEEEALEEGAEKREGVTSRIMSTFMGKYN